MVWHRLYKHTNDEPTSYCTMVNILLSHTNKDWIGWLTAAYPGFAYCLPLAWIFSRADIADTVWWQIDWIMVKVILYKNSISSLPCHHWNSVVSCCEYYSSHRQITWFAKSKLITGRNEVLGMNFMGREYPRFWVLHLIWDANNHVQTAVCCEISILYSHGNHFWLLWHVTGCAVIWRPIWSEQNYPHHSICYCAL